MTSEQAAEQFEREMIGNFADGIFQEKNLLLQAISQSADYLKRCGIRSLERDPEDGVKRYRAILQTVIGAIKWHSNRRKIEYSRPTSLHAVQEHLAHHGEEYYYAAKEVRSVATMLPRTLQGIQSGVAPDTFIDVLAAANQIVKSKGGRKKKLGRIAGFVRLMIFA